MLVECWPLSMWYILYCTKYNLVSKLQVLKKLLFKDHLTYLMKITFSSELAAAAVLHSTMCDFHNFGLIVADNALFASKAKINVF